MEDQRTDILKEDYSLSVDCEMIIFNKYVNDSEDYYKLFVFSALAHCRTKYNKS